MGYEKGEIRKPKKMCIAVKFVCTEQLFYTLDKNTSDAKWDSNFQNCEDRFFTTNILHFIQRSQTSHPHMQCITFEPLAAV